MKLILALLISILSLTRALDLPEGNYTADELEDFENKPFNSEWSSKTPVDEDGGTHGDNILTVVLDFKAPGSPITSDGFGDQTSFFDVTAYGFLASQFDEVAAAILAEVDEDFFGELVGSVAGPPGQDLAINFILGDIGTAPPGVDEFYFIQIGSAVDPNENALGRARLSAIRNSAGTGPNVASNGDVVGTVYTDNIQRLGGLTPSNALTSGNLGFTTFAIGGTLSHEIGHALSLLHINKAGSVTPRGVPPLMGTGAIDLPNQDRIADREFATSGNNDQNSGAFQQHIQQLTNAVGLHSTNGNPPATPTTPTITPPTPAPPPSQSAFFCFSTHNTVDIQGKGLVTIDHLEIGDWVRVRGRDKYAQVYSLGHRNFHQQAEFVQITAETGSSETTIELTSEHLLFVQEQEKAWNSKLHLGTRVASSIKLGDVLVKADNTPAIVTRVDSVKRHGVYTPFTTTGDIMVSGLMASNYATIVQDDINAFVSFHWVAHNFKGFHRLVCRINFDLCAKETYTADGVSTWVPSWYSSFRQQHSLVQGMILAFALPFLLANFVLEHFVASVVTLGLIATVSVIYRKQQSFFEY